MRFMKRPVVIDAQQWDGSLEGAHKVIEWADSFQSEDECIQLAGGVMSIWTLEGEMRVSPGDWIIRGVQGEFYPCKPDIFLSTYQPVSV